MEDLFNNDALELQEEQTTEVVESDSTEQATESAEESDESAEEGKTEDEKLNPYADAILAEMNRRAEQGDEQLAKGLQSKDKSIKECCEYMEYRAKKHAEEQKMSGAVCVWMSDADGYSLAVHYYTESKETIDAEMKPKPKEQPKSAEQKKKEETTKKIYSNPLLASLMKKGAKVATDGTIAVTKTTEHKDKEGNILSSKTTKMDAQGNRTTSITKNGQTYTMTEFSLF